MTRSSRTHGLLFSPLLLWLLLFLSSCDWIPYIQKQYEGSIGQKRVAMREEALLEYETGTMVKYDKSKRDAIGRKLYYMGTLDTTLLFLWQRYDHSTFSASTDRTLEKSVVKFDLQPFPFTINVRGFTLLVHEADTSHITYTLLSAEPTDFPDTTVVKKPKP
jgi:hypothetical protein